jgi:hypothetical protein
MVNTRCARWRLRSVCVCILLLLFSAAVPGRAAGEYQRSEVASLKVEIDSDWGVRTAPGYLPVRFDITNLGDARVIQIASEGTRHFRGFYGMSPGGTDILQAVRLARGDRVRLTIPVPIYGDNESLRFELREDGRTLERFSYNGFQSRVQPSDASALIVAETGTEYGAVAANWIRQLPAPSGTSGSFTPGGGVTPATGMPALDFMLGPARLPSNWLGYTSLRAVLIGPAEWERLDDAQKNALLTWTACGGDLFFVDGDLRTLFPAGPQLAASAEDRSPRGYFFGRIHRPTTASLTETRMQQMLTDAQKLQDANLALPANSARDWGTIATRGFRLPIPGFDGIPARAYIAILVLFAIVIGPANYRFLRRHRKPALLVLTAPLISLVFVLLLTAYVVVGEGFAVHGRAVTVTMLDQVRNQASTRSSSSLYAAGMTPSGGLRFPRHAAIFPIGPEGTGSRGRQLLDLTDAQSFSSGLIEARSPTNVEQVTFRTARERLSFTREGGGLTVVNGLGATVTALFYREGDTLYTLGGPLRSGSKATMKTAAPAESATVVPSGLPLSSRLAHLFENQPAGSYFAVLERSPFWEPGVSDVVEHDSFHLVIGWPEGQP